MRNRGPLKVPYVFANVNTDLGATDDIYRTVGASVEISLLVKDAVVGQDHLVIDAYKVPVESDSGQ